MRRMLIFSSETQKDYKQVDLQHFLLILFWNSKQWLKRGSEQTAVKTSNIQLPALLASISEIAGLNCTYDVLAHKSLLIMIKRLLSI